MAPRPPFLDRATNYFGARFIECSPPIEPAGVSRFGNHGGPGTATVVMSAQVRMGCPQVLAAESC
jgi:hypothetical protein